MLEFVSTAIALVLLLPMFLVLGVIVVAPFVGVWNYWRGTPKEPTLTGTGTNEWSDILRRGY